MNQQHMPRKLSDVPLTCTSCRRCPATGCSLRAGVLDPGLASFSRRTLLSSSAGTVALAAIGGTATAQPATGTATATATALTCVTLTPEQTEGPYYIDDLLLRDDITEGREGIPLALEIMVMDVAACAPLADAAVDIWHADASGEYSSFGDSTGQTFMRGVQLTDADGIARIATVYPGWYPGRTIHIHLKVHQGGTAEDGTYLGGTTAHTGQLYFDDEVTAQVAQVAPYNARLNVPRTLNQEDGVLRNDVSNPGIFLALTPTDPADISLGFVGKVTLGIDSITTG